jgi:hypothetical protein
VFEIGSFETLSGSSFQQHQKRAFEMFQQHALDAVETLIKRNDS